jgi:hypothetical protein
MLFNPWVLPTEDATRHIACLGHRLEVAMSKRVKHILIALTLVAAGRAKAAYAQSTVVVPVGPPPRAAAEHTMVPNPPIFSSGVSAFTVGYVPAVVAGFISDHKGDDNLFIPVVGPWLDLGNRSCSGATLSTDNGPFEIASGKHCGTSDIETFALIASGVFQGVGALGIVASFVVPARAVVVADPKKPSLAIAPSSFGGRGAGAVVAGQF